MIRLLVILTALWGSAFAAEPLEARVADALKISAGLPQDAEVAVRRMTPVRGAVETIRITRFDQRTGRFEAEIAHGAVSATISGSAAVTVPVVVAKATLRRGHVIDENDLQIAYLPTTQVPEGAFILPEDLVGAAVRRSLAGGRPVRESDIGRPMVVQQNAAIEIVYETAGMELSARGRALDEGAVGDSIRVVLDGQGNIVRAEVAGPSRVLVR
jgi:flagella basal body P-ring formation protein FlgA